VYILGKHFLYRYLFVRLSCDFKDGARDDGYVFGHAGDGKRKFMQREHGESYQLMRQIKETIDPKWLMNPDKIFSQNFSIHFFPAISAHSATQRKITVRTICRTSIAMIAC
jgi:hypothetical protein